MRARSREGTRRKAVGVRTNASAGSEAHTRIDPEPNKVGPGRKTYRLPISRTARAACSPKSGGMGLSGS